MFLQWQEVTVNIARRDNAIRDEVANYDAIVQDINNTKKALDERKLFLQEQ